MFFFVVVLPIQFTCVAGAATVLKGMSAVLAYTCVTAGKGMHLNYIALEFTT